MIIKYAVIKYFAILLSVIQGVLFIWGVTFQFSGVDLAFILLMFGLITYLVLFDFGLGKPIYSCIRQLYVNNSPYLNREVALGKVIVIFLTVVVSVLSIVLFSVLYYVYEPEAFHFISIALISLYAGVSIGITMFKDVFDSVNKYLYWEWRDLTRKLILFVLTPSIYFDPSLLLFSTGLLTLNLLVFLNLLHHLNLFYPAKLASSDLIGIRKYIKDAFYNFQFRVNELFIYNWGYVLFPLVSDQMLIVYSIFNRLFLGVSVGIRAITDINIHYLTKMFFDHQIAFLRRRFKLTVALGIISSLTAIILLILFKSELNTYWLNDKVSLNNLLITAFSLYLVGNAITHSSGLLLISTGGSFRLMSTYSRNVLIGTMIVVILFMYLKRVDLGYILISSGVIYFLAAFWYLKAVIEKIKVRENG